MTFPSEICLRDTDLPFPKVRGKVRDVYDLGDQRLLIVSTDRISAFDWVLPVGIPGKGVVLNQLSRFWFETLDTPHHMLGVEPPENLAISDDVRWQLAGRCMLTRQAQVIPYECVVRGYLEGSGWREYQEHGCVCGVRLPSGLRQCDRLPEPIFTPATKAQEGHDINVTFQQMASELGTDLAERLRAQSLDVYRRGSELALAKGILIADTKFEWGWCEQELILIDEVLTPDSSRFWPEEQYRPGESQPSYDKQFVREWLTAAQWDRHSSPPPLPESVIQRTQEKYFSVYEKLTGRSIRDCLSTSETS
jgi:phosphoribosylaminoimidazole-succinocarboxamide synthase